MKALGTAGELFGDLVDLSPKSENQVTYETPSPTTLEDILRGDPARKTLSIGDMQLDESALQEIEQDDEGIDDAPELPRADLEGIKTEQPYTRDVRNFDGLLSVESEFSPYQSKDMDKPFDAQYLVRTPNNVRQVEAPAYFRDEFSPSDLAGPDERDLAEKLRLFNNIAPSRLEPLETRATPRVPLGAFMDLTRQNAPGPRQDQSIFEGIADEIAAEGRAIPGTLVGDNLRPITGRTMQAYQGS